MGILNMVYGGWQSYKTYTELKDMTLSDALTELNSDAQGYYDNLNGDGHMLWICIANDDKTNYQCWDVSPIIYWNWSWRNWEIIIIKIKTDNSGNLKIPHAWFNKSTSQNAPYNWWVSYDNWTEVQYSWTGAYNTSITIASWLTADSEHTVVIRPNSESYWWALAFWFWWGWVQTYLTEIIYDWTYKWYGSSSTNTWNYFRANQYKWCTNLISATPEVLPSTVTTIWASFRTSQYNWCTSLVAPAPEVILNTFTSIPQSFRSGQYGWCTNLKSTTPEILPDAVTSIWEGFRSAQYNWCTSLITPAQETLPNTVTSVWNNFRAGQYTWCTSLKVASAEVFDWNVGSIWTYFRAEQYRWCTNLISAAPEVLPNTVTSIWTYFRTSQYNWCTSLINPAPEALSNIITSIWNEFRAYQYSWCKSLKYAFAEVLPDTVTSIWTYFRDRQYGSCSRLIEIQWWKDLSIWNTNYRYSQFSNCNSNKTIKVLSNVWYAWQNNTLSNASVSKVLVPSSYLSNFTWATIQPRSAITDSKFVWY